MAAAVARACLRSSGGADVPVPMASMCPMAVWRQKKVSGRDRIYYLGGGQFGVVTERRSRGRLDLQIRERIEYEPRKRVHPWHDHDEEEEEEKKT